MSNHKLHTLYTGHYRCGTKDRTDVTVKGQDPMGKFFAPTWPMVMGVKNGTMSKDKYVELYVDMLKNKTPINAWDWFFSVETRTLVCFCAKDDFCHRNIIVNYCLQVLGSRIHYGGWNI